MESLQIEGTPYNLVDIIFITSSDKEQGVIRDTADVLVYLKPTTEELSTRDSALLQISPEGELLDYVDIPPDRIPSILAEYIQSEEYSLVREDEDINNIENIPQGIESYFSTLADALEDSSDIDALENTIKQRGEVEILDSVSDLPYTRSEVEDVDKYLDPHVSAREQDIRTLAAQIEFFIRAAAYHRDTAASDAALCEAAYKDDPENPRKMRAYLLAKKKLKTIESGLMSLKHAYYDEDDYESMGDDELNTRADQVQDVLQEMQLHLPDPTTDIIFYPSVGQAAIQTEVVIRENEDNTYYVPSLERTYESLESAIIAYMASEGATVDAWKWDDQRQQIYRIPIGEVQTIEARNLDGTGPEGEGPKTGRGKGKCDDEDVKKDKKDKNKKDKKDKNKKDSKDKKSKDK